MQSDNVKESHLSGGWDTETLKTMANLCPAGGEMSREWVRREGQVIQGKNRAEPNWLLGRHWVSNEGGTDGGGNLGGDICMMWPDSGGSVWSLSVHLPQLTEACLTPCSSSVLGSPFWAFPLADWIIDAGRVHGRWLHQRSLRFWPHLCHPFKAGLTPVCPFQLFPTYCLESM